jgi:hypothetical protein
MASLKQLSATEISKAVFVRAIGSTSLSWLTVANSGWLICLDLLPLVHSADTSALVYSQHNNTAFGQSHSHFKQE